MSLTEAAVCLWEACLEENYTHYTIFRVTHGVAETRMRVISFAEQCHQAWELAHPKHFDESFDWEWCPMFMLHCVDSDFALRYRTPERAAQEIIKHATF